MQYFVSFSNKPEFATAGLPGDFAEVMREDVAWIRSRYAEGVVRQAWAFDRPERGGALLVESGSRAELDALIADVPLMRAGYNDCEIYPLAPYPGFAPDA